MILLISFKMYTCHAYNSSYLTKKVSFDKTEITGKIIGSKVSQSELDNGKLANVQCFPLYSILLAHGQNWVDFFSLDVEGHELQVLKTIPWHKVNITVRRTIIVALKCCQIFILYRSMHNKISFSFDFIIFVTS